MKFNLCQKRIRKRLLEIIYNSNLSHIGSCLSVIDIIESIYDIKKRDEKFVLSNGHSAISLYVVLEKHGYPIKLDSHEINVHPDRNTSIGIDVSTGSLGQGLPIAIGIAIANPTKKTYCLISDGEAAEGSIWEGLRIIKDKAIFNLKLVITVNGWGAYDPVNPKDLIKRLKGFGFHIIKINGHNLKILKKMIRKNTKNKPTIYFAETCSEQFSFLKGLDAHYCTMSEDNYQLALKELNG